MIEIMMVTNAFITMTMEALEGQRLPPWGATNLYYR